MKKLLRRSVAFLRGTFVTDCPKCHQHFYGFHEWEQQVLIDRKNYRFVCHRCAKDQKNLKLEKL